MVNNHIPRTSPSSQWTAAPSGQRQRQHPPPLHNLLTIPQQHRKPHRSGCGYSSSEQHTRSSSSTSGGSSGSSSTESAGPYATSRKTSSARGAGQDELCNEAPDLDEDGNPPFPNRSLTMTRNEAKTCTCEGTSAGADTLTCPDFTSPVRCRDAIELGLEDVLCGESYLMMLCIVIIVTILIFINIPASTHLLLPRNFSP